MLLLQLNYYVHHIEHNCNVYLSQKGSSTTTICKLTAVLVTSLSGKLNFQGKKTLQTSSICESFLQEFRGMASFGGTSEKSARKFFPQKIFHAPTRESFLPRKVFFHTVH